MPNTADIAAQAGSLHAALSELVPVFEHAMKTPGYGQDESSREEGEDKLDRALDAIAKYEARILAAIEPQAVAETFQQRVQPWMLACFGEEISADRVERGDRLLEEVFELLQSGGYDPARVLPLRDYVWSRDAGEPSQEVGGVEVTLAAYCLAHGLDKHVAGETELARIWTKVEQIRAKQAAKPKHSPLPVYPVTASDERAVEAEDIAKIIDPHSFLLIRSEHEWEEDMVKSSQELALSKANRILALRPQSAAAPKAQPVQDIVSDERAVEAEPALSIARAAANEMLAANTQWRLDPKYILTICDALEAAIAAAPKAQPVQDIASEKAAGALERAKATLELYHRGGLGDEHFYADLT
ncbi:MAG TPA: hypothetical protein VGV39_00110, partial [Mesorhizobium sp.]|nr:hypothetical protein [Mesorhizobium sp.]